MSRLVFTVLGCGSSPGVPRMGGNWGACDPNNPKNRRLRCALLVEKHSNSSTTPTRVLIDTGPDLRAQALATDIDKVDGVLYTHAHADHVHGIDDLRGFVINQKRRIEIYCDTQTSLRLHEGFGYCFKTPEGSEYPPLLNENRIKAGVSFSITGEGGEICIEPFEQIHGNIHSLGFRFGGFAYATDVSAFPDATYKVLEGLDVLILDALRYTPHPSHFSLSQAVGEIARIRPKRAILTHMHIDLDYNTLFNQLPAGIEPGYDGLTIELEA